MADQYPEIKPSGRSFKLGTFPTKVYRSLSGATVKRSFGNRATGYELRLEYNNVSDSVTAALLDHYTSTDGGFERFTLPTGIFAGMSGTLISHIQSPTSIRWEYAGPPDVQSVYTGLSRVSITLAGELDY
jgi:hypothetical protein